MASSGRLSWSSQMAAAWKRALARSIGSVRLAASARSTSMSVLPARPGPVDASQRAQRGEVAGRQRQHLLVGGDGVVLVLEPVLVQLADLVDAASAAWSASEEISASARYMLDQLVPARLLRVQPAQRLERGQVRGGQREHPLVRGDGARAVLRGARRGSPRCGGRARAPAWCRPRARPPAPGSRSARGSARRARRAAPGCGAWAGDPAPDRGCASCTRWRASRSLSRSS